jgi:spore coat assembly protein
MGYVHITSANISSESGKGSAAQGTQSGSSHQSTQPSQQIAPAQHQPHSPASYFQYPATILHLDGDPNYLNKSMRIYTELNIPAFGVFCPEDQMADLLKRLLPLVRPDVLVATGHDGVFKTHPELGEPPKDLYDLKSYKNSANFLRAVNVAREYEKGMDNLVIISGACQSYFEALINGGSNFASAPGRVLIHALDPVYVAVRVSLTSMREVVNLADIIKGTISGFDGMGGIETVGQFRIGLPKPPILTMANVKPAVN